MLRCMCDGIMIRILVTTSFITFNLLINIGNFIYLLYKCVLSLKHRLGYAWKQALYAQTAEPRAHRRWPASGGAAPEVVSPPNRLYSDSADNSIYFY